MKGSITITPGFEAGSEFCRPCIHVGRNEVDEYDECEIFEGELKTIIHPGHYVNDYYRCAECLESENQVKGK